MAEPAQTSQASGMPPEDRKKTGGGLLRAFPSAHCRFSAVVIIFAAIGLVPYQDMVSVLLASLYIYAMSRFVFPPVTPSCPGSFYKGSEVLRTYVAVACFLGLDFPLAYIMLGVVTGNQKAVQAAAPHTFLLASQIVTEQMTSTSNGVSLPARALVPILYNSVRLVSIWEWIHTDFAKAAHHEVSPPVSSPHWVFFGCGLAVANLLLWSYNLFGFLLPMYLPLCLRQYFEDEKAWNQQRHKSD